MRNSYAVPHTVGEPPKIRHVPSTVVIGANGPCVARGYTEIGGLRFHEDRLLVGRYGEYVIDPGPVEPVPPSARRRV